jgi:hypothetical protein
LKRTLVTFTILLLAVSLSSQSKGLEFLKSLAVPGLSQVTNGRAYGYGMMVAEVGIISGMFYINNERDLKARETYEFAIKHAHINPGDYSEEYFRNLSRFNSSGFDADGFNARVRQTAMDLYPNDPISQQLYIDNHAYGEDMSWNWDSPSLRGQYSKIRIKTQDLRDFGKIAVGVLILNHLVSGIDVLRFFSETTRSQVYFDIKDNHPMLMLGMEW